MSQETNLNVSPYFDDFNINNNYYKVLYKPGYPIQARELTTQQSILQNQIEQFGNHIFKEGSVVVPGNLKYENSVYAVEIEPFFNGIPISAYFNQLNGKKIRGQINNVSAQIFFLLRDSESERSNYTLYVKFLESGGENFDIKTFVDSETLVLEEPLTVGNTTIQSGQGFCNTISRNSISLGSYVSLNSGIYFVRGTFAKVQSQSLLLDQYGTLPSYKVGFNIEELIVNSFEDESLNDNSQGFSNYAAPGADRFKLNLILSKKELSDTDTNNFVEIFRVENGIPSYIVSENPQYNIIRDELAKRTFDESGDYVVKPFTVFTRECLNDRYLTNGVYYQNQTTSNGNIPSEDLLVYQIGPGKAYVKGYDVESISTRLLDIEKPRTTQKVEDVSVSINAGTLIIVNNSYGSAPIGFGTQSYVSLMDSRLGSDPLVASGTTIGQAMVYDYIPESSYEDEKSRMHLRLFNIETYTIIGLSTVATISTPAYIKGVTSNASGFLKESVINSNTLTLYSVSGQFLDNEKIVINGTDNSKLIVSVKDYELSDIKSIYSNVGLSTFNADLLLSPQNNSLIAPAGTTFNITGLSGGISTVTSGLTNNFINVLKENDIISYRNSSGELLPVFNKVNSVSAGGTFFTIEEIQSVPNVCVGTISTVPFSVNNIVKLTSEIFGSSLVTPLPSLNTESIELSSNLIFQRRKFSNISFSNNSVTATLIEDNIFFSDFDEDRYLISYENGNVEKIRFDKFILDQSGKLITFVDLSESSGICEIIATVQNLKPNSKLKRLNKVSTILIDKSILTSSGIGTTTLNDGLTYSKIYGLRVQDEEISLNVPDVIRVLGIYESSNSLDPQLPKIQLSNFSGPNNSNIDYKIGEIINGQSSGSVAIVVSRVDSDKLEFSYLGNNQFVEGETIVGLETNIESVILQSYSFDNNIISNYLLNDGQTLDIYDYSKIVRKPNTNAPKRKLKIVFQNYTIDPNDNGEFISVNSYSQSSYKDKIPSISGTRCSNLIDIRPRVQPYNPSSNRSPFESDAKVIKFNDTNSNYTLVPNNIILSFNEYVGRFDKVVLNKDGDFEVIQGIPSKNPILPKDKKNSITIANLYLPPYIFNVRDILVEMVRHRRYKMSDISLLEDRIERLEEYTTLSLSELKTETLTIKDSETGFDRFKCGFFVDNFLNGSISDQDNLQLSCEITDGYCGPIRSTVFAPLQLGSSAIDGVTSSFNPNQDQSFIFDLGSPGIKKTGDLITLNYTEELFSTQSQSTKSDDIGANNFWRGNLQLSPSSDSWFEQSYYETNSYDTTVSSQSRDNVLINTGIQNERIPVNVDVPKPVVINNIVNNTTVVNNSSSSSSSSSSNPVYITGALINNEFGGNADAALEAAQNTGRPIIAGEGAIENWGIDPNAVDEVRPPAPNQQYELNQDPWVS